MTTTVEQSGGAGPPDLSEVMLAREGGVVTITMNRPDRRNALSLHHLVELHQAIGWAGASDARVIVLAGAGPVFSAGHDFADVAGRPLTEVRHLLDVCTELMLALQQVPQPVIARVHGLATAAGCQLVASADLAVASTEAAFALPGGKGGWYCHTPLVAVGRCIGRKRANELAMTGDPIDARTALDWGLVNEVVEPGQLDDAVADLARRVSRGAPDSSAWGKQTYYAQIDLPLPMAYRHAVDVMAAASQTPDAAEGMAAFLGKRPPHWAPASRPGTGRSR